MVPEDIADAKEWLTYAEADLGVAKHLFRTYYPKPLAIICYHCQQAGEKAIKALYLAKEIPGGIPRKHDLWFLLEQMKNINIVEPAITILSAMKEADVPALEALADAILK